MYVFIDSYRTKPFRTIVASRRCSSHNSLRPISTDARNRALFPDASGMSMDQAMTTRLKLKPGQKGTKKLVAEHGDALVCVRYRYDEASRTRIKTVELIVEKTAWTPAARKFTDNELVPVRIGFTDSSSREKAKAVQGRWDPEKKLWFIRYEKVKGMDLEKHIVLDARVCFYNHWLSFIISKQGELWKKKLHYSFIALVDLKTR